MGRSEVIERQERPVHVAIEPEQTDQADEISQRRKLANRTAR